MILMLYRWGAAPLKSKIYFFWDFLLGFLLDTVDNLCAPLCAKCLFLTTYQLLCFIRCANVLYLTKYLTISSSVKRHAPIGVKTAFLTQFLGIDSTPTVEYSPISQVCKATFLGVNNNLTRHNTTTSMYTE